MNLRINSMGKTQCLMCFNNTEKCIPFPMEDTEKMLNNCLTYLDPSIAIKPVCNNDQLFCCNHCFDFVSELNKLEGRLEILQNRLSNLSSTFSRAIMCRRQLFSKRKKETSKTKINTAKMTKKSTPGLNVSGVSSISSADSSHKINKIYLIQPKQNYTIIGNQLQDNIRGDLAETDLSDPVIAPSCQNLLLNVKSETNTYNAMDTIDSIEDPFIDKDIPDEFDTMDILIHKNLPNPNTNEEEEDIIDIENIKYESDSRLLNDDRAEDEQGLTNLQDNQHDFSSTENDFTITNNAPKDKDEIVNSEEDDEIIILSDSESETSKSTESLKTPTVLLDTVEHVDMDKTNEADENSSKDVEETSTSTDTIKSFNSMKQDQDEFDISEDEDEITILSDSESETSKTGEPLLSAIILLDSEDEMNISNEKEIDKTTDENTGETSGDPLYTSPEDEAVSSKNVEAESTPTDKIERLKCTACPQTFKRKSYLEIHKRIHTGEKPYKCLLCNLCFRTSEMLCCHKKTHDKMCPVCSKCFSQKKKLELHIKTHTESSECRICGKLFMSTTALKLHQRIHNGEQIYKCSHCEQEFTNISKLNEHERYHTGEKPFKCSFCTKVFSSIDVLLKHENLHKQEDMDIEEEQDV